MESVADRPVSPSRNREAKASRRGALHHSREGVLGDHGGGLCARAGVTKGAFFHHFDSKEALGVAALAYWSSVTGALFAKAPYHQHENALCRVLAYIDFRRSLLRGAPPEFTCLAGTMVQETYESHPPIREACAASIFGHAHTLESDIAEAMAQKGVEGEWSAESLAAHTQAVLQGAFILAKANGDAAIAIESVEHLRRYVELLFGVKPAEGTAS